MADSPVSSIRTYADAHGRWHVEISFSRSLSESDPREEFNLGRHWVNLRRRARAAIVRELAEREQKTHETRAEAEARMRTSLGRLAVTAQKIGSTNLWYGVTFGEPA